jgi:hypothetical protein
MSKSSSRILLWSGIACAIGALLHMGIIFGGPDWYAFFGAPARLVQMAREGNPRAPASCLIIAAVLLAFASYAFSGVGILRRLPLLRTVLFLIGGGLILRGVIFIPLAVWFPSALARVCDCHGVDAFLVVTSTICLAVGLGYSVGAVGVWRLRGGGA